MDTSLNQLKEFIPANVEIFPMLKFIAILAAALLGLGLLCKLFFGEKSDLNHALSSTVAILAIYAVTIVVYTFDPRELSRFLSPLPFAAFSGEYLLLLPLASAEFSVLCDQLLSLIILAFLVNLLDTLIPKGKSVFGWCVLRILAVTLAMGLHYGATWAVNRHLSGLLAAYAPMILLGILVIFLLLGLLKLALGLVLGAIDPIVGALSAFFFSNLVGKQLSKAVLTAGILVGLIFLLERTGYTVICISAAALTAYVPLILVLLALWFVIGYLL